MKQDVLGVKAPAKECTDRKCPFHGEITVKPELFRGRVIQKDLNHSATIEWSTSFYVAKYERFETRRSRMRVHNPACINADVGQKVLAAKTKPLSKTKHHVVIQITDTEKEVAASGGIPEAGEQIKKKKKVIAKGEDHESA